MPKKHQNDPRSAQKRPQNDQKSDPEREDDKRTEPRRSQDRLGSAPRGPTPVCTHPRGSIWEAKSAPKSIPKRSKIEAKNQDEKKRSKTILDPSWGDLGPSWVPSWADLDLKIVLSPSVALVFLKNPFFDVKTVRRRLWDQLWPTKAPK